MKGAVLKRLRNERNLTIAELAEKCGVGVSTISEIERGRRRPSIDMVGKIAKGLGLSAGVFLDKMLSSSEESD